MATGRLFPQPHSADEASWSYETAVDFLEFKGPNQCIHFLVGTGAPSTNNLNAPLGSIYMDSATGEIYTKTAAGTWTNQT